MDIVSKPAAIMKAVVMTILLFITTETYSAVLRKDNLQTNWGRDRGSLHNYLNQMSDTARGAFQQINNSKIGKQLNLRISENLENLGVYVAELQKIVTPLSDDIHERFQTDSTKLEEKFREALKVFKAKVLQYTEGLHNKVNHNVEEYCFMLGPLVDDLKENAKGFQQTLTPLAEEVQEKMSTNIEDFNKNVSPYAKSVHEMVNQQLETLQQNTSPYTRKFKELFYECFQHLIVRFTHLSPDIQECLTHKLKT